MSFDFSRSVSVSPGILLRELDGECVLLNLQNETYYGLDETGNRFWLALVSASSIEAACDQLIEVYEVSQSELNRDMEAFVNDLLENGLLAVSTNDDPSPASDSPTE